MGDIISIDTVPVAERGTYVVTVAFDDGATPPVPVTPVSISWSLTDATGAVINSRKNQAITPPLASQPVVLSGADLPVPPGCEMQRLHLVVEITYLSLVHSATLPLKWVHIFTVQNLAKVVA
jgi:hypothetical protein